jgi:glycosyltransferase involved in cell wall biosynthesis
MRNESPSQSGEGTPLISVVVPNLNQGKFIGDALNSIFSQGYHPLEVTVMDGGSCDESMKVIEEWCEHITDWRSEPDAGQYDAVNKGMALSRGEILCFLNSDDKFLPGCLQIVGEIFQTQPEVNWLTTLAPAILDLQGNCVQVRHTPGYSREAFLDGRYGGGSKTRWFGHIQQESTFWRRSLWEKAGGKFESGMMYAGDFELWGRFFERAELYGITAPLSGYRIRESQRARQGSAYHDQCAAILGQFREKAAWTPSLVRELTLSAGLLGVRKIGGLLRRCCGYTGKMVQRINAGSAEARWEIREYRFP